MEYVLGFILGFLLVLVIRALCFKPKAQRPVDETPVAFDQDAAVTALQKMVQCKTISYNDKALEDGGLLGVNGNGYIVQYTRAEDGTYVVTNLKSFVIPETGGTGTYPYQIGGLVALATALIYGYSLRRKRERGASS